MSINLNPEDHPDDALLEDARMSASSDWEETFVADILALRNRLGPRRFMLTEAQRVTLKKIAGYQQ